MRTQRGAVTAEAALAIPVLTGFAVALVFLVNVGIIQVRSLDAAREAARMVARGDSIGQARATAKRVAAGNATVRIIRSARYVKVQVAVPIRGPGGLLSGQLGELSARAEAAMEPTAETGIRP